MAYRLPANPETLEDKRLYTEARLTDVSCLDCTVHVRVKKNSDHHTSIQWDEDGTRNCPEFNRLERQPGGRQIYQSCPRLEASIDAAVREGIVKIGAEDGY